MGQEIHDRGANINDGITGYVDVSVERLDAIAGPDPGTEDDQVRRAWQRDRGNDEGGRRQFRRELLV